MLHLDDHVRFFRWRYHIIVSKNSTMFRAVADESDTHDADIFTTIGMADTWLSLSSMQPANKAPGV